MVAPPDDQVRKKLETSAIQLDLRPMHGSDRRSPVVVREGGEPSRELLGESVRLVGSTIPSRSRPRRKPSTKSGGRG